MVLDPLPVAVSFFAGGSTRYPCAVATQDMSGRLPLLFSSRDRHKDGEGEGPRLGLALGAVALCCAAAGAAVAWRTGHAQRVLRVLWEGDKEGRARARQLKASVW